MTGRPLIDGTVAPPIRPADPDYDPLAGHTPADYPFLQQAPERAPLPPVPPSQDYASGSAQGLRRGYGQRRYANERLEQQTDPGFTGEPFSRIFEELGDDAYADQGWEGWPTNPIDAVKRFGFTGGAHGKYPSAFVRAVLYQLRQFNPGMILGDETIAGRSAAAMQMLSGGMPGALETQAGTVDEWGMPPAESTGNVHIAGTGEPEWWRLGIEAPPP